MSSEDKSEGLINTVEQFAELVFDLLCRWDRDPHLYLRKTGRRPSRHGFEIPEIPYGMPIITIAADGLELAIKHLIDQEWVRPTVVGEKTFLQPIVGARPHEIETDIAGVMRLLGAVSKDAASKIVKRYPERGIRKGPKRGQYWVSRNKFPEDRLKRLWSE